MRDLVFKNLTSANKKRKVISSCEIIDKEGVRSIIRRHFVCLIKEVANNQIEKPLPYLYILKEHNSKEQKEKFFFRLKASACAVNRDKKYLIIYLHSLKIDLVAIPQGLTQYS